MRNNKFFIALLVTSVAGISVAQVHPKYVLKYRGPFSDLRIAKNNINYIRMELDSASPGDVANNPEEIQRVIKSDLPLQFRLVEASFLRDFTATEISLSPLRPEQIEELWANINATTPDLGVKLDNSLSGKDFSLYITLSMKDIAAKGSQLLERINSESGSEIEIAKSEFSLALARFDILTAYLTICVESSPLDL